MTKRTMQLVHKAAGKGYDLSPKPLQNIKPIPNHIPSISPKENTPLNNINVDEIVERVKNELKPLLNNTSNGNASIGKSFQMGSIRMSLTKLVGSSGTNAGNFIEFPKPFETKPTVFFSIENGYGKASGGVDSFRFHSSYTLPENELKGFYIATNYRADDIVHWIAIEPLGAKNE